MIEVKRIFDIDLIKETLTNISVYNNISDDLSPLASEYNPVINDLIIYIGCYKNKEYAGLFMFHPYTFFMYEVHTCLLPSAWGFSVEMAKIAKEWFFENTKCIRIITTIPENNKLALRMAKKTGFTEYGFNPNSWVKNKSIYGSYLLGINKEGLCQQQFQPQL